jgi:hypothetical protein
MIYMFKDGRIRCVLRVHLRNKVYPRHFNNYQKFIGIRIAFVIKFLRYAEKEKN